MFGKKSSKNIFFPSVANFKCTPFRQANVLLGVHLPQVYMNGNCSQRGYHCWNLKDQPFVFVGGLILVASSILVLLMFLMMAYN